MPIQLHRRAVAPMTSHVTCGLRCWPSTMPSGGVAAPAGSRPFPSAGRRARTQASLHCRSPPNVPRPCGPSAAARVGSIFRLRDGSHEARDGAGGERAELVRAVIAPSAGSVMPLSRPASPGGALEIEPAALLPVSIDRRTVSPTTRPAPASRMHGWPAVADLTSDRPIRIALVQVGAAPKAPAHFKLSQQISQRSDPFLGSLKPRGAQIAWLVFPGSKTRSPRIVKDASKQKALRFARLSIQHPDLDHINPEQCQKRDDNRAPKCEESLK